MSDLRKVFILLSFTFFFCKEETSFFKIHKNQDIIPHSDAVIKNFQSESYQKDKIIWKLFSKEAYLRKKENKMYIFELELSYFQENKEVSKVQGKKGILNSPKKILKIKGEVFAEAENGKKLYTEYLEWDEYSQKLSTDFPVKIISPDGTTIEGIGLIADKKLNKITIKRVKGKVKPR